MSRKTYDALANFLKFFINRPNHLSKYLIDHGAINKDFLRKISEKKQNLEDGEKKIVSVYFKDIEQMNLYFDELTLNEDNSLDKEALLEELEMELGKCLSDERYEDAIRIRDYLKKVRNHKRVDKL